ncbi:hypothetical protein AWB75_06539 [Caballeronia catudaia]|uniref:Uncharacterized protein n=1 Tax=Caballeronia catudaia TaxID=1777136 RepID=A0A158DCL1_9BURK|nr:PAAR domain-containing protein [Caballeronia catudaia]SAK92425.1 hypothetical protein AWB75_06539 [Caballeronia catudaia]
MTASGKKTYLLASIGSRTERGGFVSKASGAAEILGLRVALVGDIVRYSDGSEAVITDGAGYALTNGVVPYALVGSSLSNGDRIVKSLMEEHGIHVEEGEVIEGLFDPSYVVPPQPQGFRLAMRGSTTARGGVLHETSGWWDIDGLGHAAEIGDVIHYPDGSTARIVTGLALKTGSMFKPLGYVGSLLDNGDVITDSPERKGVACSGTFEAVADTTTA